MAPDRNRDITRAIGERPLLIRTARHRPHLHRKICIAEDPSAVTMKMVFVREINNLEGGVKIGTPNAEDGLRRKQSLVAPSLVGKPKAVEEPLRAVQEFS